MPEMKEESRQWLEKYNQAKQARDAEKIIEELKKQTIWAGIAATEAVKK